MITNFFKKILDKYRANKRQKEITLFLNDGRALFSSFGDNVYFSDFVNNCIDRIAAEISKISVMSVVEKPGGIKRQNDDITRLFRFKPNPLQTAKDFLASVEWLRRKDCNAFIYPQFETVRDAAGAEYRKYTAFWPLNPTQIEIGTDDKEKVWEIKFYWRDGSTDVLPYEDLVHLKWRRGKNLIVGGGNDYGRPDTKDLQNALGTLNKVIDGLPKAIEASLKITGVYTVKTLLDQEKIKLARDNFEDHIFTSKAGVVATDLAGEFTPVANKPVDIKNAPLQFLKAIIRERYGISDAIISGDYTGEQHSAFYQNCIEEFIVEFEQAMSVCLFSQREQDIGHRIKCYYDRTSYLSTQDKIEMARFAADTGAMSLNQINAMFGIEPFDEGDRRLQSLNFVSLDIVDEYQAQESKIKKIGAIKNE
ncbi:MAG: phage portal protein [Acidaminococcales bacterium]|nr:phage portal protein [Acidaminococcales bacterium]